MRDTINHPTLDDCRAAGARHASYGWARTPWGHWDEARRRAYFEGYDAYVAKYGRGN